MIGYFIFIVLFVFSKDNHCYEQPNTQCEKIVNTHSPYDSPDFNQVIEPETFPEETPNFIPVTVVQPDPFPEETPDFNAVTELETLPEETPDFIPVTEPDPLPEETVDFNTVVEPDPLPEKTLDFIPVTEPDPLPEETLQPNDFETAYLPTLYLEHGILVKAYDIRLSLFPENNTYIQEENNSITIKMKPNNFIFQIYS